MRALWAITRFLVSTALGCGLVWAFSDPTPEWAQQPLQRPARFDVSPYVARLEPYFPDLRSAARAVATANVHAAAPVEPDDGRTPPPFIGLGVPEAAVELARAAQPLVLEPVQAETGAWVVGYGRELPQRPPEPISPEQAELMLREDLERAAAVVRRSVRIPLNANELGALAEFARSIGVENFERTLVLTLLNAGDREAAADAFLLWSQTRVDGALVQSEALAAQRERTRALFLTAPEASGA